MSDESVSTESQPSDQQTPPAESQDQQTPPTDQAMESQETSEETKTEEAKTEAEAEAPTVDLTAITFPEGFEQTDEDKALLSEASNVLTSEQSPQEKLQALVDLQLKAAEEASERASQRAQEAWDKTEEEWRGTVKADPVVGGDKLEGTLAGIGKLIETFSRDPNPTADKPDGYTDFSSDVREGFDITGAGNHPAIVKFLNNVAVALNEPGAIPANPGSAEESSPARRMYPSMKG